MSKADKLDEILNEVMDFDSYRAYVKLLKAEIEKNYISRDKVREAIPPYIKTDPTESYPWYRGYNQAIDDFRANIKRMMSQE